MHLLRRSAILATLAAVLTLHAAAPTPRVNHIAFYVLDLKVSTDFYTKVVGLPVIPEPFHDGKHTWFAIGPNCALHVISGAAAKLPKEKRNHLCFTVPSVDEYAAHLAAHKVPYEDLAGTKSAITRRPDGVNQIYFQDPDDNWIEINDAKE